MDCDPLEFDELSNSKLAREELFQEAQEITIELETELYTCENDSFASKLVNNERLDDPVNLVAKSKIIQIDYLNELQNTDSDEMTCPIEIGPSSPTPYECSVCRKMFESLVTLQFHMAEIHNKKLKCPHCVECFSRKAFLEKHLKTHQLQYTSRTTDSTPVAEVIAETICIICDMSMSSQYEADEHIVTHSDECPFECPDCADLFEDINVFQDHIKLQHGIKEIRATSPQIYVSSLSPGHYQNIDDPENLHPASDYSNVETAVSFISEACLNDHQKQHNELPTIQKKNCPTLLTWQKKDNKIRPFKCSVCDRSFTLEKTLALHNRRTHLGIKPYKCVTCNWDFAQSSDLIRHQRKHTGERPYKCEFCRMSFSQKRNLVNHSKIHTQKSSKCKYCNHEFQLPTSLEQHLKKHEGEHALQCPHCEIPYSTERYLSLHIKRVHSSTGHACLNCNKVYATVAALNRHAQKHTGELPFTCKLCGKSFTQQTILNNHQVIHSGRKDFQCTYCGQSFSYAGNLKVHIRTHTGEKPFDCKVCQKSFTRTPNLYEHMKTHTGEKEIKCEICGKDFASLSTYAKHKKIHTGERPHKCHLCDKSFRQSAHLKKHILVHTGEKPFSCEICGKFFRRTDSLKLHQKRHCKFMTDNGEHTTELRTETLVDLQIEVIDNIW